MSNWHGNGSSEKISKWFSKTLMALKDQEDLNDILMGIITDFIHLYQEDAPKSVKDRYFETIQGKIAEAIELKKRINNV